MSYIRTLGAFFLHHAWELVTSVPDVVIFAPDYSYLHSGVRCLHLLCDRLNRLGISAAVTASVIDPRANTPRIDSRALTPAKLDRSLVVYPEVTAGNPLGAKHVIRYLLNKPGVFGPGLESYGEGEFFVHFAEEFRPAGLKSHLLRLPLIDTLVFSPPKSTAERHGFLVYSHRYRPDAKTFPDWIDQLTTIRWEAPRDPPTLADLYRSSRAVIVGERTAAVPEALHCHCPVIMVPNGGFEYEPLLSFFGRLGIVVGFDRAGLNAAIATAPAFADHYAAQFKDIDQRLLEVFDKARRFFDLSERKTINAI
jgi:hypothetical protein